MARQSQPAQTAAERSTALDAVRAQVRAANYLSAAQIYLKDNFLLERPLEVHDIKQRLLGHWGTCPGINFVYAHLNRLIKTHQADVLFVLGPGHGFPALQANLFIEGTLTKYDSRLTQDEAGLRLLCRDFSWPYGFPSHSNPATPGVILEGGELGYSLATAYGAVLDNPDLIAACLVGDGEAETGPTAAAWHLNKLVDPRTNGTVLPILHLNGYKISGPTVFGRMSNHELRDLFSGYGYEPHIIQADDETDIHAKMNTALELCYETIRGLKSGELSSSPEAPEKFPMIILKTDKGWTGIEELHGQKIAGNFPSHQVPAKNVRQDSTELAAVEAWLKHYQFSALFDATGGFTKAVTANLPPAKLRMGDNAHARAAKPNYRPLKLPPAGAFAESVEAPGTMGSSSMRRAGFFLNEVFKLNESSRNFRMLSPDETYSNKLDAVFDATARAWVRPTKPWDRDLEPAGRVMELLSEHTLQGLMQGYVLTGRHAVFASYEAFLQIISSMVDQYSKFIRVARTIPWRGPVPSLNYIVTSSGWRQEHNGFSHQNPAFIDDMLNREGGFVNVYFPPDGNSTLVALRHMLGSTNEINLLVAGKTVEPRWLTTEEAERQFSEGIMVWKFASDTDPDLVFSAAGSYLTLEALAALSIVKRELPQVRLRFVSIMSLSPIGFDKSGERRLSQEEFDQLYTPDAPIVVNFHGYPQSIKQILFDYTDARRFSVPGYQERGSTTTPFDIHVRNGTSRYDLAIDAATRLAERTIISSAEAERVVRKYQQRTEQTVTYVKEHGIDPPWITNWQWPGNQDEF